MRLTLRYLLPAFAATCLLTNHASAVVITFNGTAAEGSETYFSASTYSEAGFTIANTGGYKFFVDNNDGGNYFPGIVPLDDDVFEFNSQDASFVLTQDGGGAFDLVSVLTGSLGRNANDDGNFIFTGLFAGGGTISQTVSAMAAADTTFFAGFTNLTSVTVTAGDGLFPVMDNLTVTPFVAPAPSPSSVPDGGSTLALLSGVFMGFVALRRRFSK